MHDRAVLGDPTLVTAVATGARLNAVNVMLDAELRERLGEVAASRRRLLVAADEERERLADELRAGVEHDVVDLRSALARIAAGADGVTAGRLAGADQLLDASADDLRRIGAGLHPRDLDDGLDAAVRGLCDRSPVPVTANLAALREIVGATALAAYCVCAEALTNAAKHGAATRIELTTGRDGTRLRIDVSDDGRGGADPALGTGLRGVADRVEAMGGAMADRRSSRRRDAPAGRAPARPAVTPVNVGQADREPTTPSGTCRRPPPWRRSSTARR